jgi:outer membrane lipoprotein-sorting protein
MKRICGWKWGAAALSVALAVSAARAQEEEASEGSLTWYAQVLARSESQLNVSYFWSKGSRLRSETVLTGFKIVTIVNGDTYYAYDAVGGRGVAVRRAPAAVAAAASGERPFGRELENLLRQGAEKVGEETVMGRPCDVYRLTDRVGKRELWVTQDSLRLPVRVAVFNRATGRKTYTDFVDWLRGIPISDGFFEPEEGVELKRYTLEEYLLRTARDGPVGPVPILFTDLLHGKPEPVEGAEGPTSPPPR